MRLRDLSRGGPRRCGAGRRCTFLRSRWMVLHKAEVGTGKYCTNLRPLRNIVHVCWMGADRYGGCACRSASPGENASKIRMCTFTCLDA
jgi:hypothetical protein